MKLTNNPSYAILMEQCEINPVLKAVIGEGLRIIKKIADVDPKLMG